METCKLVEELKNREGVQHIWINPEEELRITADGKEQALEINKGPVIVLVIWD